MVRLVNQVVSRESRYLTLRRALAWLKYLNARERERENNCINLPRECRIVSSFKDHTSH